MTQNALRIWLYAVAAGHVLIGLSMVVIPAAWFDPYLSQLLTGLNLDAQEARSASLFWARLFGPTVAAWGILFTLAIRLHQRHGESWIKSAIVLSLLAWVVPDSLISWQAGAHLHLPLNLIALAFVLIPLWWLRPDRPAPLVVDLPRFLPEEPQAVLVTGGSGFIGRRLVAGLIAGGHAVTVLTRNPAEVARQQRGPVTIIDSLDQLPDSSRFDALINLAGEPLAAGRWTATRKQEFIRSRVQTTRDLAALVARLTHKPRVLLNASAVGFYGDQSHDRPVDESAAPQDGFSHQLCAAWEAAALELAEQGLRVCLLRLGVVLGRDGGPWPPLRRSYTFGAGVQMGDGEQWLPWVHLEDVIDAILFAWSRPDLSGPLNLAAPEPLRQGEFTAQLIDRIPTAFIRLVAPSAVLRTLLGEMAQEVLLSGQRVMPARLQAAGFEFRYPDLAAAIAELEQPKPRS